MKDKIYYEKYGLLFYESEPWERDIYGFNPCGLGDCITNTMRHDIKTGEIKHLQKCSDLLNLGKRWPDVAAWSINYLIAKNRIDWEWSKFKRFRTQMYVFRKTNLTWKEVRKLPLPVLFRPQHHITRDPVCWHFSSAILNGQSHFIYKYRHPWNLNTSITFWAWVRFIKTGKCEGLYLLLENMKPLFKPKEYAIRMKDVRLEVYNYIKSEG